MSWKQPHPLRCKGDGCLFLHQPSAELVLAWSGHFQRSYTGWEHRSDLHLLQVAEDIIRTWVEMPFALRFSPTLEKPKRAKQGCESTVSQGNATAPHLAVLWDHCSQILKSSMLERITTTLIVMGLGGNWLSNFFWFCILALLLKVFSSVWQVAVPIYVAVSK